MKSLMRKKDIIKYKPHWKKRGPVMINYLSQYWLQADLKSFCENLVSRI
jgi:hypothetical protein